MIRDQDADGRETVKWCVMFNAREGAPGELVYRIDRLIIDRCLEKQTLPPSMLRLGTLSEICDTLGMEDSGVNKRNVKTALLQLQGTAIEVAGDLAEGRFYRYPSIIFTGDKRVDGTRSDAVYLELSTAYQAILRKSVRRPLDYDYLCALPPGSSRLYEILSSRIFAALQKCGKNPEARLLYSEFTELSALTRYMMQWEMKKQMKRLNEPHLASGYISGVSYDARTDRYGKPDWMMIYVPGAKARQEFRAAKGRGEVEPPAEVIDITARPEPVQAPLALPGTAPLTEKQKLAVRLAEAGVSYVTAQELVKEHWESATTWLDVHDQQLLPKNVANPGAYLAKAIATETPPPKAYLHRKEGEKRAVEARQREAQQKRQEEARKTWEQEEMVVMHLELEALSLEALERFDREALEAVDAAQRHMLNLLKGGGREATLNGFRLAHWRRLKLKGTSALMPTTGLAPKQ